MIREPSPAAPLVSAVPARRALDAAALALILLAALRLGADHVAWVNADLRPGYEEDSAGHATRLLQEYAAFYANPGLGTLVPEGNYPPLLTWFVWAAWGIRGLDDVGFRMAQVPFTVALAVGAGLAAWRAFGRGAGVAAAGLAVIAPHLYVQRSNVMLALAVTGALAVFYAAVPLKLDRLRPAATVGAGIAGGVALLGHLSAAYFVAATGFGVVLHYAIEVARDRSRARVALGRLGLWAASAAAVCAPYYLASAATILHVLDQHDEKYGSTMLGWSRVYFLARIKQCFLVGDYQWAVVLGLPVALLAAWWRPALRVYLVALVGGYLGVITFPQSHDRYLLPLVPLLGVAAVAPLGVLVIPGPARLVREVAALALGAWAALVGLRYSDASLHAGAPTPTELDAYGPYGDLRPLDPPETIRAALLAGPATRRWAGPGPHPGSGAERAVADAIFTTEKANPRPLLGPERVQVTAFGTPTPGPALAIDLLTRGIAAEAPLGARADCFRRRCYVAVLDHLDAAPNPATLRPGQPPPASLGDTLVDLGYLRLDLDLPPGSSVWVLERTHEVPFAERPEIQ